MLFSLSGSLLPAFRPCWILGEMSAVSLSGPLLPAHRPLQDNGGEVCRLLVSSPVFTMASQWKFYFRLFGTDIQLSFSVPRIRLNELILNGSSSI